MTFKASSFAVINSIVTIQSLLTGLLVVKSSKETIIASLVALLISDPLINGYSIFLTNKSLFKESIKIFLIQATIVIIYLALIYFTDIKKLLIHTLILSLILFIVINIYNGSSIKLFIYNTIFTVIILTLVYHANLYLK